LQNLNLHITVKILDFSVAAANDAARLKSSGSNVQLTQIDSGSLTWNETKAANVLGRGSFATVSVGTYKKEYVAVKHLQQLVGMSARDLKLITKEAMIMQFADHPNILKLKGVALAKGLLVMELALCSLADYLHRGDALAAERAKSLRANLPVPDLPFKLTVIRDVSDAVRYLHSYDILHRDIKSPNVLLFWNASKGHVVAKVADVGLALAVELVSRTAGTMHTNAPRNAATPQRRSGDVQLHGARAVRPTARGEHRVLGSQRRVLPGRTGE
jgi:serine/threonine protein kinase